MLLYDNRKAGETMAAMLFFEDTDHSAPVILLPGDLYLSRLQL